MLRYISHRGTLCQGNKSGTSCGDMIQITVDGNSNDEQSGTGSHFINPGDMLFSKVRDGKFTMNNGHHALDI